MRTQRCVQNTLGSPAAAASVSTNSFTKDGAKLATRFLHTKPQGRMDSATSPVPPGRVVECAHLSSRRQRAARLRSPPPAHPHPVPHAHAAPPPRKRKLSERQAPNHATRVPLRNRNVLRSETTHAEEIPFEDKDRAQNGGARAARPPFPRWALTTHHSVHSEASSSRHVSGLARV